VVATCEYFGGCLSVCLSVCSAVLQSTDSLWTFNVNISIGGSDVGPRGVVGFFCDERSRFQESGGRKSRRGLRGRAPVGVWDQSPQKQNLNFR